MIRYVLAVLFVVALLGVVTTAHDHASTVRGEQEIESEIGKIDAAASSLVEHDTPVPGTNGPQRVVEIDLPTGGQTVDGTDQLLFEPLPEAGSTRVTYSADGNRDRQTTLDVLIRHEETGTFDLSDRRGKQRLWLTLQRDESGEPVVVVTDRENL